MEATLVLGTSAERRAGSTPVIGIAYIIVSYDHWKLNIRFNAFDNSVKII